MWHLIRSRFVHLNPTQNQTSVDMCALAVPVNDSDGKFLAALAYHGPTQRLNVETLVDHLETMREGAAKLAELMR